MIAAARCIKAKWLALVFSKRTSPPLLTKIDPPGTCSALAQFEETWGRKYPHVVMSWKRHWTELATFFKYPEAVRRLIYTTNPIESLNSRVRKTVKGKSVFPTEISLFKALYLAVAEAEKRWTMKTRNWSEIMAQLSIFFQDRLQGYLC